MEFRLYCFAQSGNAFKVALMLQLCGAKWEPRFVDFFGGETRTLDYRAINEMGEAPVLEHGTKRLSQSGVILHYLADHFKKFRGEDQLEVLRWMFTLAKTGEPQVHEFLRGRVKTSLGILNSHLEKTAFAVGNAPTIADIS